MKSIHELNVILGVICIFALHLRADDSQSPDALDDDITLPDLSVLEMRAKNRGELGNVAQENEIVFESTDFDDPAMGKLRRADVKWMNVIEVEIARSLAAVSSSENGTESSWYPIVVNWARLFKSAIVGESESNLLTLLGSLCDFIEHDPEELLCDGLARAKTYMAQVGVYMIRALAYHVSNGQGVMADSLLKDAVRLLSNDKLVDETAWDADDVMPVDAAGVFIVNPGLVLEELKKRPVERVRFFVGGESEAAGFFGRYLEGGDGLEVLKAKYSANKEVTDGKFGELVVWLGAQALPASE